MSEPPERNPPPARTDSTADRSAFLLTPWPDTPETFFLQGRSAQPAFDDSKLWWFDWAPDGGVKVDELGVTMTVTSMDARGLTLQVHDADEVDQR